jgi:hypothetical protein
MVYCIPGSQFSKNKSIKRIERNKEGRQKILSVDKKDEYSRTWSKKIPEKTPFYPVPVAPKCKALSGVDRRPTGFLHFRAPGTGCPPGKSISYSFLDTQYYSKILCIVSRVLKIDKYKVYDSV